jgi:hypothetical protein
MLLRMYLRWSERAASSASDRLSAGRRGRHQERDVT